MSIAKFIRRAVQPGNYTTQYGLPQSSVDYLNQPLPDISGIFSLPQATEITEEDITETESPVGLTEEQLRLLYPQVGGGDGPRGGGDFGNLDLSDTKDFFINGEVVTGFRNLNTGLYQDLQGKNIQNLGIRNLPGITGILDSMRTTAPKYPGYFDYYNASDLITNPRSFFNFFKSQTPTGADIARYRGEQKKTMEEARALSQAAAQAPVSNQDAARGRIGGGGRDRGPGETSSGTFGSSRNDASFSDYS